MAIDESSGKNLVGKLVTAFKQNVPESVSEIEVAVECADWEKVRFVSHRLVSTCGNLGFESMMEMASYLESCSASAEDFEINKQDVLAGILILKNQYRLALDTLKKLDLQHVAS